MDALQAAALLQRLDVAADSHQRHAQLLGQVGDPDHPFALKSVQNGLVAGDGEHQGDPSGQGACLLPV